MTRDAGILLLVLLMPGISFARGPARPSGLALQPLGKPSRAALEQAKAGLEKTYHVTVTLLPVQPLPKEAWYAPRNRWRADRLLDSLEAKTDLSFDKVLAVTERDISVTKGPHPDWGIFGLAQVGGRPAVVSTFRLRRGRTSETLFSDRLLKVVFHEAGHLFGLDHCPMPGCLMEDARGTLATVDAGGGTFCARCDAALRAQGVLR